MRHWLIFLALILTTPTNAQLYSCKKEGRAASLVSAPVPGEICTLNQSLIQQAPASQQTIKPNAPRPKNVKPVSASPLSVTKGTQKYTNISPQEQARRDNKRGEILLYELSREQKRLAYTDRQIKISDPNNTRRLSILKDQLRIHTLNITAIKQELSRLNIRID